MGGIPSRLRRRDAIASGSRARKAAHHIGEDFMNSLFKRSAAALPVVALVLSCAVAGAGELNPAAVTYKLPDQIAWSAPSPAGAQNALLAGDPTKEGLYVQLVKWPAGNHFSRPHFHPHDRFITVIKGTWWVGTGTKYDPETTVPMPAGTFVTHFGQQVHYDGAKDEDAILLIVGEGPGTSTPAEVK
jgi:quercetin dioxygenase-like cupin family protein